MIPVPQPVLEAVCAAFEIDPRWLAHLGGGGEESEGIVYAYPWLGGSRVLKIGALAADDPAGLLRLEERLKFVHFLGEHGVEIVYPLARADGSLFACIPEGEMIFVAYCMEKINGSHPPANAWDPSFIRRWGQTIGRTHRVTQAYPTWQCTVPDPLTGQPILGWEQEWADFYKWCEDKAVKQAWLEMRDRLAELPVSRDSFGFIHNDPHQKNILVSDPESKIVLLDFDVANYHWFVTDIAITMQGLMFDLTGGMHRPLKDPARLRQFLDLFMQGYETENHLDPTWLGQPLDLSIRYRRMLLFTVMQGWLKTKPRLRAGWKKMILDNPEPYFP